MRVRCQADNKSQSRLYPRWNSLKITSPIFSCFFLQFFFCESVLMLSCRVMIVRGCSNSGGFLLRWLVSLKTSSLVMSENINYLKRFCPNNFHWPTYVVVSKRFKKIKFTLAKFLLALRFRTQCLKMLLKCSCMVSLVSFVINVILEVSTSIKTLFSEIWSVFGRLF